VATTVTVTCDVFLNPKHTDIPEAAEQAMKFVAATLGLTKNDHDLLKPLKAKIELALTKQKAAAQDKETAEKDKDKKDKKNKDKKDKDKKDKSKKASSSKDKGDEAERAEIDGIKTGKKRKSRG
jgi:hypothetical protein